MTVRYASTPPSTKPVTLLAVIGMSPAILTETIWALAGETPAVVPAEVVVITTSTGWQNLESSLLQPVPEFEGASVWESLRASILALPAIRKRRLDPAAVLQLSSPRIIELPDPKRGVKIPAADIRSVSDNDAAADFILETVRQHVENDDRHVVASIAGGRKTMTALLYAAMSLLGRETDRVTHVLVGEPFETCREFFYPDQPGQELTAGRGESARSVRACDARIDLANIPFVPLRKLFERDLARRPGTFGGLVAQCSQRMDDIARHEIHIAVRREQPHLVIDGTTLTLAIAEYLLLLCLAKRAKEGRPAINSYSSAIAAVRPVAEEVYAMHDENDFSDWRFKALPEKDGFDGIDERWITRNLSSLRTKLRGIGPRGIQLVALLPTKERFSLDLPPENVRFVQ